MVNHLNHVIAPEHGSGPLIYFALEFFRNVTHDPTVMLDSPLDIGQAVPELDGTGHFKYLLGKACPG
jgi:hypothetical protein